MLKNERENLKNAAADHIFQMHIFKLALSEMAIPESLLSLRLFSANIDVERSAFCAQWGSRELIESPFSCAAGSLSGGSKEKLLCVYVHIRSLDGLRGVIASRNTLRRSWEFVFDFESRNLLNVRFRDFRSNRKRKHLFIKALWGGSGKQDH